MPDPFTDVSISGYNSNPPADDGSQATANKIKWSTHISKIGNPLKTALESLITNVGSAFDKVSGGVTSTGTNYTILSSDQGKLVVATAGGITITTPDATVVGAPFKCSLLNNTLLDITLDGNGSQTVDGVASVTIKARAGVELDTDGSNWFTHGRSSVTLPRGYIDGCILANGTDATNDINVAAGVCRDSTNAVDITVAAMAGKQLDANWAPGAAAGMRNSAAGITDTTYHIYAVAKDDGTQDIYAHTSETAATVITALQAEPGGSTYVYARCLGSIVRASASIRAFTQIGDDFTLTVPILASSGLNPGTSAVLVTTAVPAGIKIKGHFFVKIYSATSGDGIGQITSPDQTDTAPAESSNILGYSVGAGVGVNSSEGFHSVFTDTSARVRTRITVSSTNDTFYVLTLGWTHPRGKNI